MNLSQLQAEIISCTWSEGFKKYINETQHHFSDHELLSMVYHFAPDFENRLRLFRLLADHAPAVSDHAKRCIAWQEKALRNFCTAGENETYELHLWESKDSYEERYLCASYDTALQMIDAFYQEYNCTESIQAKYIIDKREIIQPGQSFREDNLGSCHFSAGKTLNWVFSSADANENGNCDHVCVKCQNRCVANIDLLFPHFLSDGCAVQYRNFSSELKYGIHLRFDTGEPLSDSFYVIPLDSPMMQEKNFDQVWHYHDHDHIPGPDIEEIPVSDLDSKLQENYAAFTEWMKEHPDLFA